MRPGYRKTAQEEIVGKGEDRGVGTYAEYQREKRNRGEYRGFTEHANSVAQVFGERLKQRKSQTITIILLCKRNAAEFDQGLTAGFLRVHAGAEIVIDMHQEIALDLLRQLQLALFSREHAG